jgi:hypothetical protein
LPNGNRSGINILSLIGNDYGLGIVKPAFYAIIGNMTIVVCYMRTERNRIGQSINFQEQYIIGPGLFVENIILLSILGIKSGAKAKKLHDVLQK